jgi:hypothetical protein
MAISAEIRWFWRKDDSKEISSWFLSPSIHGHEAGGGQVRIDAYWVDTQYDSVGIKIRGNKPGLEIKGLLSAELDHQISSSAKGMIEVWSKWTCGHTLPASTTLVSVSKRRWLRKYAVNGGLVRQIPLGENETPLGNEGLPQEGCNFEWTEISSPEHGQWHTLGFEAFGTEKLIKENLVNVMAHVTQNGFVDLRGSSNESYPSWLKKLTSLPKRH